jgi:hypothetical protein
MNSSPTTSNTETLADLLARAHKFLERRDRSEQQAREPLPTEPPVSPPVIVPVLPETLGAFKAALIATKPHTNHAAEWWTKVAYRKWAGRCVYCDRELQPLGTEGVDPAHKATCDHLIPITVGGPDHHEAVVLACMSCNASKSQSDWITWGKGTDKKAIRALRAKLSRESWNHLAQDPVKTKTKLKIERMLEVRWAQPRFLCHASLNTGGAFIGWKDGSNVPTDVIWQLRQFGGKEIKELDRGQGRHRWVFCFDQPAQALDAIWALIERNALVRRLDLSPAFPDATPSDSEALALWPYSFPNVGNLVKRRWDKPNGFRGHSQAWREGRVSKGSEGRWVVHDP